MGYTQVGGNIETRPVLRPNILSPLFTPVTTLPGVGVGTALFLGQLQIKTFLDLLWHLPTGILTRQFVPHLALCASGQMVTLKVRIVDADLPGPGRRGPQRTRILCEDSQGKSLTLVYFKGGETLAQKHMGLASEVLVSGKIDWFQGAFQIVHPDFLGAVAALPYWCGSEALYPLTKGMTHRRLQGFVAKACEKIPSLEEWIPESLIKTYGWPDWVSCLKQVHAPTNEGHLALQDKRRQRLAFDEFFASQLSLLLMRGVQEGKPGRAFVRPQGPSLREAFLTLLPFELTGDQHKVMGEIDTEMEAATRMVRLLQGDVGTGKTVVAMAALLNAIEGGAQGALMAPTEVLARQHAKTLLPWLEALGIKGACLTGSDKEKDRRRIYEEVSTGHIKLLIGTHSLIQDDVIFQDLGLVVIDEQHRFGVEQRLKLVQKGKTPDVLSMTATPIPRTLMLASYGDLSCSYLREKPMNRQNIVTSLISLDRLEEVMARLATALEQGHKIYWVCPLIEESQTQEIAAAQERFEALKGLLPPEEIGIVHGRINGPERDATMQAFRDGDVRVLVATTVIEVGVDVQDATIMIIEHAERFGLSQLHQLRGRIGRGDKAGRCLLLYSKELTFVGRQRLEVMKRTQDGFEIAEKDLQLRGGGEMTGSRQSGLPEFRLGDPVAQQDLLELAHTHAHELLEKDPSLSSPQGTRARLLLHLFSKAQATAYLSAA